METKEIINKLSDFDIKIIESGLQELEVKGISKGIVTELYLLYKLSDIDAKPMYKGLNFRSRLKEIFIKNNYEVLINHKIILKGSSPFKSTSTKIYELQQMGLDVKIIADKLKATHFILSSNVYSEDEKIKYFKTRFDEPFNLYHKNLWLNGLELSEIPTCVLNLKDEIITLRLNNNPIKVLPIHISKFYNLKSLDLEKTKIISLPNEIEGLKNLEKLNLDNTKIINLPAAIGKLEKLKELRCVETNLTSIPDEISNCENLESIIVFGSKIENITSKIGNLKKLKMLNIRNTPFSKDADKIHILKSKLSDECELIS